jgi:SOS-response transcriptional repressor LexA
MGGELSACATGNNEPFALRVIGDSMLPEFASGQIVIVDPSYPLRSGMFIVADYGGEVMLGRYVVESETHRLIFLNADYAPLTLVQPYEIKGVVIQRAGRRRAERKHYEY